MSDPTKKKELDILRRRAEEAGQGHVFRYWGKLSSASQQQLLRQIAMIDFTLVNRLYRDLIVHQTKKRNEALEPAQIITLSRQRSYTQEFLAMKQRGEALLRHGKIAALLVAGGQGSRLGFEGPKGIFPGGPVSGKSLFQMHAEKILALSRRYGQAIPWYVMTSESNDAETRAFFEERAYFGLPAHDVFFFIQGMMPAIDEEGKIILDAPDHVFMNPDGHGGTLVALEKNGALDDMRRRGIEEVFYFQVDNVLINICDPVFIGYHAAAGAEMSAKVCAKRHPNEKVGIIGRKHGKLCVIEYSDMSEADKHARNPDGVLKYNSGSIAIHLFNVGFLESEMLGGTHLPWHVAHKAIPYLDENGESMQPEAPNGYKFETFIFDALSDARKTVVLEVDRQLEFSPVKNSSGEDSPATAQRDLCNFYASWLEACGVRVERDSSGWPRAKIEISPLFALDAGELAQKIPPDLQVENELFLEKTVEREKSSQNY